ncbi:MAG: hypothetical protein LAT55_10900, partial [Opitutales bacterium]|nr:hypothetical protein [Opitutales bacterium]
AASCCPTNQVNAQTRPLPESRVAAECSHSLSQPKESVHVLLRPGLAALVSLWRGCKHLRTPHPLSVIFSGRFQLA